MSNTSYLDQMASYQSSKLVSHRNIRLVKIYRKSAFGLILRELIQTPLDTAPAYEAISYT